MFSILGGVEQSRGMEAALDVTRIVLSVHLKKRDFQEDTDFF